MFVSFQKKNMLNNILYVCDDKMKQGSRKHITTKDEKFSSFIWILSVTANMFCTHNLFPLSPIFRLSASFFLSFFSLLGLVMLAYVCLTRDAKFTLNIHARHVIHVVACYCLLSFSPGTFFLFHSNLYSIKKKKKNRREKWCIRWIDEMIWDKRHALHLNWMKFVYVLPPKPTDKGTVQVTFHNKLNALSKKKTTTTQNIYLIAGNIKFDKV